MEKSDTIVELAKALSKMQGQLKSVPKTSNNPFFKSKYADLDAVWEVVRKPLTDNGLSVIQTTYDQNNNIYLETMLLHTSGEWIRSYMPINATKQEPQAVGSALTYCRRYSLSAILGVSADEDDDAESTTDHKNNAKMEIKQETRVESKVKYKSSPEARQRLSKAIEIHGHTPESIKAICKRLGFPEKSLECDDTMIDAIIKEIEPKEKVVAESK